MENSVSVKSKKIIFPIGYYLAHVYLIVYVMIGLLIEFFKFLSVGHYRVMSIATWPWIITQNVYVLLISILLQSFALFYIASSIRSRLDEFPINLQTMGVFPIYFFCYFLQIIRLGAWFIGP